MILLYLFACNPFVEIGFSDSIDLPSNDSHSAICSEDERKKITVQRSKTIDRTFGGKLSGESISYTSDLEVPIVVLMDHSGSMYNGYPNRQKKERYFWEEPLYRKLLSDTIFSFSGKAQYYPMLFNSRVTYFTQSSHDTFAEEKAIPGFSAKEALNKLTSIEGGTLTPDPRAFYSDSPYLHTDLGKALDAAMSIIDKTENKTGVVWLITDNRDDRGDSPEAQNTKEFYNKIMLSPFWQIAQLDPIIYAPWLPDSSLVVYRLLYSKRESLTEANYKSWIATDAPLSYQRLNPIFKEYLTPEAKTRLGSRAGTPIRMKPNNLDLIDLQFSGLPKCQVAQLGTKRLCSIEIEVENKLGHQTLKNGSFSILNQDLFPYRCSDDTYSDESTLPTCKNHQLFIQSKPFIKDSIRKDFTLSQEINPIDKLKMNVEVSIPAVEVKYVSLKDYWIGAFTPMFQHTGFVEIDIDALEAKTFIPKSDYKKVYNIDNLPENVEKFEFEKVHSLQCMTMYTKNPSYFLAVLVSLGIGAGVVLFSVWGSMFRKRYFIVEYNGKKIFDEIAPLGLRRLSDVKIDVKGKVIANVRMIMNGTLIVTSPIGTIQKQRDRYLIQDNNYQDNELKIYEKRNRSNSSPTVQRNNEF